MAAGEGLHELLYIVAAPQGKGRQVQAGDPTFGALVKVWAGRG
ncbi:MAG: hypothetical protein ACE5OS_05540 [Anaerolineae bacterium]